MLRRLAAQGDGVMESARNAGGLGTGQEGADHGDPVGAGLDAGARVLGSHAP
jgi:hypothetical protein